MSGHAETTSAKVVCIHPESGQRYEWCADRFYIDEGRGSTDGGGYFSRSALVESLVAAGELTCAAFFTYTCRMAAVVEEFPRLFDVDAGMDPLQPAERGVPVAIYHGDDVRVRGRDATDRKCRVRRVMDPSIQRSTSASSAVGGGGSDSDEDMEGHGGPTRDREAARRYPEGHVLVPERVEIFEVIPTSCKGRALLEASGSSSSSNSNSSSSNSSSSSSSSSSRNSNSSAKGPAFPVPAPHPPPTSAGARPVKDHRLSRSRGVYHPKMILLFTHRGLYVVVSTANLSCRGHTVEGSWVQFFPRTGGGAASAAPRGNDDGDGANRSREKIGGDSEGGGGNGSSSAAAAAAAKGERGEEEGGEEEEEEENDFGIVLHDFLVRTGGELSRFGGAGGGARGFRATQVSGKRAGAYLRHGGPLAWARAHYRGHGPSREALLATEARDAFVRTFGGFRCAAVDLVTSVPGWHPVPTYAAAPPCYSQQQQQHCQRHHQQQHHCRRKDSAAETAGKRTGRGGGSDLDGQESRSDRIIHYGQYRVRQLLHRHREGLLRTRIEMERFAARRRAEIESAPESTTVCVASPAKREPSSASSPVRGAAPAQPPPCRRTHDWPAVLVAQQTSLGGRLGAPFFQHFAQNLSALWCREDDLAARCSDDAVFASYSSGTPAPGDSGARCSSGSGSTSRHRQKSLRGRLEGERDGVGSARLRIDWPTTDCIRRILARGGRVSGGGSFFRPSALREMEAGAIERYFVQYVPWTLDAECRVPHIKTYFEQVVLQLGRLKRRAPSSLPTLSSERDLAPHPESSSLPEKSMIGTNVLLWCLLTSCCLSEGAMGFIPANQPIHPKKTKMPASSTFSEQGVERDARPSFYHTRNYEIGIFFRSRPTRILTTASSDLEHPPLQFLTKDESDDLDEDDFEADDKEILLEKPHDMACSSFPKLLQLPLPYNPNPPRYGPCTKPFFDDESQIKHYAVTHHMEHCSAGDDSMLQLQHSHESHQVGAAICLKTESKASDVVTPAAQPPSFPPLRPAVLTLKDTSSFTDMVESLPVASVSASISLDCPSPQPSLSSPFSPKLLPDIDMDLPDYFNRNRKTKRRKIDDFSFTAAGSMAHTAITVTATSP